jgi:uncharacterized protein (DUF2249 family)
MTPARLDPLILDIQPILDAGGSPCGHIEDALRRLAPNQSLVIIAPFEPIPLYTKLGMRGFDYATTKNADGAWRVEFTPGPDADLENLCGCGH